MMRAATHTPDHAHAAQRVPAVQRQSFALYCGDGRYVQRSRGQAPGPKREAFTRATAIAKLHLMRRLGVACWMVPA